uniref:V-SNARE coiled-coil homology domain-containing protein n=1 Tax=Chelonoidis abingdonii TaxID=106734 RepID=A0A8C0GBP6_CHEAB
MVELPPLSPTITYKRKFGGILYHKKAKMDMNDITISTLQIQVDDVKNVISQNVDKVLQRAEKLSDLIDRTDDLQIEYSGNSFISLHLIIVWHFQKCLSTCETFENSTYCS